MAVGRSPDAPRAARGLVRGEAVSCNESSQSLYFSVVEISEAEPVFTVKFCELTNRAKQSSRRAGMIFFVFNFAELVEHKVQIGARNKACGIIDNPSEADAICKHVQALATCPAFSLRMDNPKNTQSAAKGLYW